MREVKELVPVLAAPVISTVTQLRYGEQLQETLQTCQQPQVCSIYYRNNIENKDHYQTREHDICQEKTI